MFLKRLEITGFKSFPDKIRLEFHPGVTAVVGPNGSGKSNISDALRWVMGEQSAKSLRGARMEDVIFSGTEYRRPLGYAEVNMLVDNAERKLPVDFNEVVLTRRVYRSGESEYAINGAACRLKDVHQLFMDTGVGREGYSIIGQGRVDDILSVRSEDRRQLFEEAAGIVKFKTRRNEALGKLERERQHLTRVNDIIEELSGQLTPLSEQAEQARSYLSLREQYKTIHVNLFLEEAEKKRIEQERLAEMLSDLQVQLAHGERLLTESQSAGALLKNTSAEAENAYKKANQQWIALVTEIEKKESAVNLLKTRLAHNQDNRTRLLGEMNKREQILSDKQGEQAQEEAQCQAIEVRLAALKDSLSKQQIEFEELALALRERERALDQYNAEIVKQVERSAALKSRIQREEEVYEALEEQKERVNSEILHIETLLEAESKKLAEAQAWLKNAEAAIARQQSLLIAYKEAHQQLTEEWTLLKETHEKTQSALQTCAARHRALSELEQNYEGYYRSVRTVLRKKKEDVRFSGICGAVGELLSVSADYGTAVEIALGSAAQYIVTRTEDDARLAIDLLKQLREGRATFLPLTAVRGQKRDYRYFSGEPGYIDIAGNLVAYEPAYEAIIAHLLGNVIVMDGVENAVALFKKTRYAHKLVTLDGSLLSPGGAMTGGSINRQSGGLVGRSRQVAELAGQLSEWQAQDEAQAAVLKGQADKLQTTEEGIAAAQSRMQDLLLEKNNAENRVSQSLERLQALKGNAEACQRDNLSIMDKLVSVNKAIREAKQNLQTQEGEAAALRRQMDAYQNFMTDERVMKDEQTRTLTSLQVEIGRLSQALQMAKANHVRITREWEAASAERTALSQELEDVETALVQGETDIQNEQAQQVVLQARLQEQKDALATCEKRQAALRAAISEAETDERAHREAKMRLEQEAARLEMRKEQIDADSRRLYDEIWEEYGLTFQSAQEYRKPGLNETDLRREEKRLKAALASMTDVNVGAIEAHKALKTRYDFMTAQRDDINQAEEQLRDVVKTLTQEMERRFAEQFTQISIHFNKVFQEMFGGGKAGLSLLDESNILESGIEISAQPPGKQLQNLMLLSGGERALTAIALLFGILRMKPSPFCVLDEIEAALDDANVSRFAQYIKQYAGGTQFIIITHRKGTMEAADALYGVTMQELGVSKLVSVRLGE